MAFVGASGCGKSTLVRLLSGLYKPWRARSCSTGCPFRHPREVFTGSVAVVDQDVILFEDTIANNLRMWDSSIENYELILAARDAQIHADIMQREGGYAHKLLEGGKNFSGGQRQRMEITRVLAQDPTVVLMDEATSALDARTEHDVVKSIEGGRHLRGGRPPAEHHPGLRRDRGDGPGPRGRAGDACFLMAQNGLYAKSSVPIKGALTQPFFDLARSVAVCCVALS